MTCWSKEIFGRLLIRMKLDFEIIQICTLQLSHSDQYCCSHASYIIHITIHLHDTVATNTGSKFYQIIITNV